MLPPGCSAATGDLDRAPPRRSDDASPSFEDHQAPPPPSVPSQIKRGFCIYSSSFGSVMAPDKVRAGRQRFPRIQQDSAALRARGSSQRILSLLLAFITLQPELLPPEPRYVNHRRGADVPEETSLTARSSEEPTDFTLKFLCFCSEKGFFFFFLLPQTKRSF